MIFFIFILGLLCFIQVSLLPLSLVLIFLICKTFASEGDINYYLLFIFGILISFLLGQPLGILSLVYLLIGKLTTLLKNTPLSSHYLFILPVSLVMFFIEALFEKFILGVEVNPQRIIIQLILVLPIYLLVRLWQERFTIQPEVKIKLRV